MPRLPHINGSSATSDKGSDKSSNGDILTGEVTLAFIDYRADPSIIKKRPADQMHNVKIIQYIGQGKGASRVNHEFWMQNESKVTFRCCRKHSMVRDDTLPTRPLSIRGNKKSNVCHHVQRVVHFTSSLTKKMVFTKNGDKANFMSAQKPKNPKIRKIRKFKLFSNEVLEMTFDVRRSEREFFINQSKICQEPKPDDRTIAILV
jgi:hypothetical protein